MPLLAYAAVLILPLLAYAGIARGGLLAWGLPLFVFGLVPLLELFLRGNGRNASGEEAAARRSQRAFDLVLYATVPLQVGLVLFLAWRAPALSVPALLGSILSVGLCCGALGLNVGHELGHRSARSERMLSRILMGTSLYAHFFVEHNRGHHARVATPEDPASARRGESLYPFWIRSIGGGFRSAWGLEATRLAKQGRSAWSRGNEVLVGLGVQGVILFALLLVTGPIGLGAVVAAALVGVLLLETVNYVEHYGLQRDRRADGGWERVRPAHSWTSNRPIGRALLFDLTRHADHHAHPARPYQLLRHFEDAPELPTGYPGMILLALAPPLFQVVMEAHTARELARLPAA